MRERFPTAETESYVSYLVYVSDLRTIYSYFITIVLIAMNSQHSYKHFIMNNIAFREIWDVSTLLFLLSVLKSP